MSYKNFCKAIELSKRCRDYADGGAKQNACINKAEELLGIKFSRQNKEYFRNLGFIEFYGHEVFGIVKDDFSGSYAGCAVEATLVDRKEYSLPKDWITIYFFDDGYMGYLDYSQLNENGEPPVIMAFYNGEEYVAAEKMAEDFGDFLLMLVEEQLNR